MRTRTHFHGWPLVALTLGASLALGASCNRHPAPPRPAPEATPPRPAAAAPTLRLYYLVDLDGYLEPCGCQSRPLGGIDRIAQVLERDRATHPHRIVVAAGNLFFDTPRLDPRMVWQERQKAERLTQILGGLGLAAYAPGPADFALGADAWRSLSGALPAAALAGNAGMPGSVVREVGGVRVGVVGVSDFVTPDADAGPAGAPAASDPVAAARTAVAAARAQGAQVVVVLASVPRRVARAVAAVEGVDFVIAARHEGPTTPAPERVAGAYLLTAPNQGKALGVVDLYLDGTAAWRDISEASRTAEQSRLDGRIRELQARLTAWRADPTIDPGAVRTQAARLEALERERTTVAGPDTAASTGRRFAAQGIEVDATVPRNERVQSEIARYFRAVNERNRVEYADLRPPTPAPGQPRYVGNEACRDCHEEAFPVWERTSHARAYRTLEDSSKNFNLSCVGCHVTGYRQPGGSEVVQNVVVGEPRLQNVQCEVCHGPASAHIEARGAAARRATIRRTVDGNFCATQCHTPEHSDHFDFATYLPRILGPGHGMPLPDDADDAGVTAAPTPAPTPAPAPAHP